MTAASQQALQNGSSDYTPTWLKDLGVKKGEWYSSSKARPQKLMKASLSTEAGRVYACLELATMAFQQELAVKMHRGRRVPLAPVDISEQTGLSKQNVRRALKELEDQGLAERRGLDGDALTKGNVTIYSWAVPRAPKDQNGSQRATTIFESLDPEFAPLIAFAKRWKIKPEANIELSRDSLSRALVAVAQAEEAQKVAVATVEGVFAPSRLNKEERNGNELESKEAGRQASTVQVEEPPPASKEPEPQSLPAGPEPVSDNNGDAKRHVATREEIRALPAVQQLEEQLHDTIGESLAAQIGTNLRDAPLESLNERIRAKAKDTRSLARLPSLANDVARANDMRKQRLERESQADRTRRNLEDAQRIAEWKRLWQTLAEADREMLRDAYPEVDWPPG